MITCLAILTVLFSLLWFSHSGTAGAAEKTMTLTITGSGVATPVTLTISDLQNMPQVRNAYTTIDSLPAKRFCATEGVKLTEILARANVNISTVEKLTFTSTDGIGITLTKQELLDTPRFYFPGIKENSEEGKVPVEPILALLFHSAFLFL